MQKNRFAVAAFALASLAIAFSVWGFFSSRNSEPKAFGSGGDRVQIKATDIFGTAAAKVGLTGTLTTSTTFSTKGWDKVVIGGTYTPATNNAYTEFLVEASLDDGVTFLPISTRVAGTNEIDVFADSGTNFSTTSGIPFIFPGDKTSTSGKPVTSTIVELENNTYTQIRITPMESVSSGNGTLWLQAGGKIGQ